MCIRVDMSRGARVGDCRGKMPILSLIVCLWENFICWEENSVTTCEISYGRGYNIVLFE